MLIVRHTLQTVVKSSYRCEVVKVKEEKTIMFYFVLILVSVLSLSYKHYDIVLVCSIVQFVMILTVLFVVIMLDVVLVRGPWPTPRRR